MFTLPILMLCLATLSQSFVEQSIKIPFSGGSECFIESSKFKHEFLYPVDQFIYGTGLYRTVCLKSLKELDIFDKIAWRIEQVDDKKDVFHLKKISNGKNEYLCSLISFFDWINGSHELKRLHNPSNVGKENCEWKIEPIESNNSTETIL